MRKKLIFITGGTGNMGSETVKELLNRSNKFKLRLLALDTPTERKKLRKYKNNKSVEIIYGNMKDANVIDQCIKDTDFVLHIGALVSPMADKDPQACMKVNYGSTINIIDAIKKQPNADTIGFVYIGTFWIFYINNNLIWSIIWKELYFSPLTSNRCSKAHKCYNKKNKGANYYKDWFFTA